MTALHLSVRIRINRQTRRVDLKENSSTTILRFNTLQSSNFDKQQKPMFEEKSFNFPLTLTGLLFTFMEKVLKKHKKTLFAVRSACDIKSKK